jgi:hypothetical protein
MKKLYAVKMFRGDYWSPEGWVVSVEDAHLFQEEGDAIRAMEKIGFEVYVLETVFKKEEKC